MLKCLLFISFQSSRVSWFEVQPFAAWPCGLTSLQEITVAVALGPCAGAGAASPVEGSTLLQIRRVGGGTAGGGSGQLCSASLGTACQLTSVFLILNIVWDQC